jgi:hypothetical protein
LLPHTAVAHKAVVPYAGNLFDEFVICRAVTMSGAGLRSVGSSGAVVTVNVRFIVVLLAYT